MSEYQYYEFLAIDRPLTAEEMSALRKLSARANITPVSFTNEYNWGDFRGNPGKLMQLYFDAHVYVANWMTAIFMVRLPIEALSKEKERGEQVICRDVLIQKHSLNERQGKALGFLMEHSKLTIQDFEKLCPDVNRRSLQRDLKGMLDKQIISSEGATHHQEYRLL